MNQVISQKMVEIVNHAPTINILLLVALLNVMFVLVVMNLQIMQLLVVYAQ